MAAPYNETLLAVGATSAMAGILLRGFAASARRDRARRRQHLLDDREPGAEGRGGKMEIEPGWFEKNLGPIGSLSILGGLALSVAAFFWR